VIELRDVTHSFDGGGSVLRNVSLRIEEGERVVVLGANGSGKTTLLRVLNGLVFPREGTFRFRGDPVTEKTLRDPGLRRSFRTSVGLLFQDPDAMLFHPTVRDEIAFGPRQVGVADPEAVARTWAARLALGAELSRPPFLLSVGEKKKVALAAILALEPRVLLLDEPTANLDPRTIGWLVDFLREIERTTVITTHNLGLARELGDRVVVLSEDHRVIHDGGFPELVADREKLVAANLVHVHGHRHGDVEHRHYHSHDWD
jgi:cobalt/nickel transport system ATP-binding protein